MLARSPFPRDAELNVLDVGAGYGVVTEEEAHVTLQDYSRPMLDQLSGDDIFECYRAIHDLLAPEGWFLNYDRFLDGVDQHMGELLASGFVQVECIWQQPPHALLVAGRPAP